MSKSPSPLERRNQARAEQRKANQPRPLSELEKRALSRLAEGLDFIDDLPGEVSNADAMKAEARELRERVIRYLVDGARASELYTVAVQIGGLVGSFTMRVAMAESLATTGAASPSRPDQGEE